ncbi:MAG: sensor histidine kinase, partial [Negativicutes bacterium]|nr:sensor histidine kinase [Negativicutes bacterium]
MADKNMYLQPLVTMAEEIRDRIFIRAEQLRSYAEELQKDVETANRELAETSARLNVLLVRKRQLDVMVRRAEAGSYSDKCSKSAEQLRWEFSLANDEWDKLDRAAEAIRVRRQGSVEALTAVRQEIAAVEQQGSLVNLVLKVLAGRGWLVAEGDEVNKQYLLERIIMVQEEERRRVARDIHDGPAQVMAGLVLRSEVCMRMLDQDPAKCRKEIRELGDTVREAIKEIRRIIYDLRPMSIDDLGLAPTIRRFMTAIEERSGIATKLVLSGGERRLPGYVEIGLFRVAQEALVNCEKHARAANIEVTLTFGRDSVKLVISDDGSGFDRHNIDSDKQFGLLGMNE